MKIRRCFVSNSSCSSFIICKEFLDDAMMKKLMEIINEYNKDILPGEQNRLDVVENTKHYMYLWEGAEYPFSKFPRIFKEIGLKDDMWMEFP